MNTDTSPILKPLHPQAWSAAVVEAQQRAAGMARIPTRRVAALTALAPGTELISRAIACLLLLLAANALKLL